MAYASLSPCIIIHWNLYNETGEVLPKTHEFCHLRGTVFTKLYLLFPPPTKLMGVYWFSLPWESTSLSRDHKIQQLLYTGFTVAPCHCLVYIVKSNQWMPDRNTIFVECSTVVLEHAGISFLSYSVYCKLIIPSYIDDLVIERRNSSALATKLRLFRTNPSIQTV